MRVRLPHLPTPGVPRIEPPLAETTVKVDGGKRRLGVASFGDPDGRLVLWFHGTPGGRRQVPPVGRAAAKALGLHVVCVERPGTGRSTNHRYRSFAQWAPDAATVADHFGQDRFGVVGLSGGGPYALACAALLPDRVVAASILGGVCPLFGEDGAGTGGGLVALAGRFRSVLDPLRPILGLAVFGLIQPIMPLAHTAYARFTALMPEGDRKVFADPGIEAMFIDDIVSSSRSQFGALAHDIALFGRDWGFRLGDIAVPVRWWHGDADNFVPLDHAQHAAARIPDVELYLRPGESHLGGFAAADDVLATIDALWR